MPVNPLLDSVIPKMRRNEVRPMDPTRTSKFLSLVLRHRPDRVGIVLDEAGWTDVGALLKGMSRAGHGIGLDQLVALVKANDKKRFAFNDDRTRIRAVQGHSQDVDLGYAPATPPDRLFHGTVARFVPSIRIEGLTPGDRQQVHLSPDRATAETVGRRRGKPVVLTIDSARMVADGHVFHIADNGVWLVDLVPPGFIVGWD